MLQMPIYQISVIIALNAFNGTIFNITRIGILKLQRK